MIETSPALRGVGAAAVAAAAALALMPVAVAVARRFGLEDSPGGWKVHSRPTPYLGGAGLLVAAVLGLFLFGYGSWPLALVGGTLALAILGTIDDRVKLPAWPRLLIEAGAGAAVWQAGLGWDLFEPGAIDLALTVAWVVAAINAFNLIDLMDGIAAAVACASCAGVAAIAVVHGDPETMVAALALAGACLGFLHHNLAAPARIFLGDGGTMPIGFLTAVLIMFVLRGEHAGPALTAAGLLFVVPLADSAYRAALRLRTRAPLLTARADSLANRLGDRLESDRLVALVAACLQLLAGLTALAVVESGGIGALAAASVLAGALLLLARRLWAPASAEPAIQPSLKAK